MTVADPKPGDIAEWRQACPSPYKLLEVLAARHGLLGVAGQRIVPYPHILEMDRWVQALCFGRLYADGPGPIPHIKAHYESPDGSEKFEGWHGDHFDPYVSSEPGKLGTARIPSDWIRVSSDDEMVHPKTGEPLVTALNIELPPRSGKSFYCSLATVIWYVLQFYRTSVLVVGHTAAFAESELGARTQRFLRKYADIIGIPTEPGPVGMSNITFADESRLEYLGVGAALVGRGRRLGVVDDPVKGINAAMSDAEMGAVCDYLAGDWATRATPVIGLPPAVELRVMSRWSQNDPAGVEVYEEDAQTVQDGWAVLHREALLTLDDGSERSMCEPMIPLRLLRKTRDRSPITFQAQYQNSPRAGGTAGFPEAKDWPKYRVVDGGLVPQSGHWEGEVLIPDHRFTTIDLAGVVAKYSDYTVVCVWDYHTASGLLFLRSVSRAKTDLVDHLEYVREATRAWMPIEFGVLENATVSLFLFQTAARKPDYLGFPLREPYRPGRGRGPTALSKRRRHELYSQRAQAKVVLVPDPPEQWFNVWYAEHASWPRVKNDDQLDCGADAVAQASQFAPSFEPEPEIRPLRRVHDPKRVERRAKEMLGRGRSRRGTRDVVGW